MIRNLLTLNLFIVLASTTVYGQTSNKTRWMDGGAGVMSASPDGLDGPLLYVRMLEHQTRWAAVGFRFEFRDDDPSRGRAQVLGFGLESALAPLDGLLPFHVYIPMHAALDLQLVGGNRDFRRVETGVFPRASIGVGLNFGAGRGRMRIEQRWSVSPGGNFAAIVAGFGTTGTASEAGRSTVYLVGHEIFPMSGAYEREPDYRGYSVVYQHETGGWFDGWRGSLGVDFVVFPSYSTGVITAMTGPVKTLVDAGPAALSVVRQIGLTRFAEGESVSAPVAMLMGLEGEVKTGGVGLVASLNLLGTHGPVGVLLGWQPRFGIAVGL